MLESLSSYARQFLGLMEKPDLDFIEGLSPAISIEQKATVRNPRSTVGTVTEIHDYYVFYMLILGNPIVGNVVASSKSKPLSKLLIQLCNSRKTQNCMFLLLLFEAEKENIKN